jgi:methionyl-tRNA formyltransferase
MKIVYLGSGDFGIECLNALVRSDHSLELIITQMPQPAGRGRKLTPTPVACWVSQRNVVIPYIETDNVNTPQIINKVAALQPDLIVVIAFGQKISNELIKLPAKGAINVHASLLPKYRGAAPINWAIINSEHQTGISIMTLAEKMDAGDILAQVKTEIGPDETAGELHDRLAQIAALLLIETIKKIAAGSITYTPQDHSKATSARKLKKADGFLDFTEPALSLRRKILGLWPWPGASAVYNSKKTSKSCRVMFALAEIVETTNPQQLPPGVLDENLNVICGQNSLKITKIKPDGASLMDFKDFINGRATRPGDLFLKIENQNI